MTASTAATATVESAVAVPPGDALAGVAVRDEEEASGLLRGGASVVDARAQTLAREHPFSGFLGRATRPDVLLRIGRASAVLLVVVAGLALYSPDAGTPTLITASLLMTALWSIALESAFAAARVSRLALGTPLTAALGTLAGLAAVSLLAFWLPGLERSPKELLAIALVVFVVAAGLEAIACRCLLHRRRVLVVGASQGGAELVEELAVRRGLPFTCIGIVDDDRETATIAGVPLLGRVEDLAGVVVREKPDIVVLAGPRSRIEAVRHLLDTDSLGFRLVGASEFYEHAFGRVPVKFLSSIWFMSVLHLYQRPYSRLTKRGLDVALATLALFLALPLLPVIALLVRLSGPGPILFRQTRLGEGGKEFQMLKFRTMVEGAEEPGRPIWAEERDPRITAIGRFLRKTRLDELPQLSNVVRGEMSVIGPRPERPEFVDLLENEVPFWKRRHLVKPGITGWAQVNHGYTADADSTAEKLSYDFYYLKHRSLLLDLAILAKTGLILISGSGAR